MSISGAKFLATWTSNGGARIQAVRDVPGGLFKRAHAAPVAPADWFNHVQLAAGTVLLEMAEKAEAIDDGSSILLTPGAVASLPESLALTIGLPPSAPILLGLALRGLVVDDGFHVERRWRALDGTEAAARVTGARVAMGSRDFRMPEPLFSLATDADAVGAATGLAGRQAAFAALQHRIGEDGSQVLTDRAIAEMRVGFAGHFSLSLKNGDDFDPVLFAPQAETGGDADEVADNILSPSQQDAFAIGFRRTRGERGAYLLPDGLLLFIDPGLRPSLELVAVKQQAPAAERRIFASNPRALLPTDFQLDDASGFIETVQYSARVVGIDPWRAPVLPWIKPRPNSWLPETFGIAIGDPPDQRKIEVSPDQVADLLQQAMIAAQAGDAVRIAGEAMPATPQLIRALEDLAELNTVTQTADRNGDHGNGASVTKLFLQVRDNLEEVTFALAIGAPTQRLPPPPVPKSVQTLLKQHQVEGFNWLAASWNAKRPGVLLADDMGLGKTLQALAFLAWLRAENAGPALIVAPTGLLANWRAEMDTHLQPFSLGKMVRAYGDGIAALRLSKGTDAATGLPSLDARAFVDAGVVLTTYEGLRDYHISFAGMRFACVLFDEVQKLKNPAAQVTRAAKTLRARFTLAMTGTPVENRLQDLWSITDVAHPSLLGSSKAFETRYGAAGPAELHELQQLLAVSDPPMPPFMLRRMKDGTIDGLPAKRFETRPALMRDSQARAYGDAVNRALALRGTASPPAMIETLQRLRSLSLGLGVPVPGPGFADNSARLSATFAILDQVFARGEKVLIFLETIAWQAPLAAELRRRYRLEHSIPIVSGATPGDERRRLVDVFQSRDPGFDAMILSPRAGGVGLTITVANHVIHLSRWWNPAVEDQATDRVYRIGQTREVTVWVPIAQHPELAEASFDHKLNALLARKRDLARGLLAEPESAGDVSDLLDAILVEAPSENQSHVSLDRSQIQKTVQSEGGLGSVAVLPRRHQKLIGQQPPWEIFFEVLRDARVVKLEVVDAYAMGSLAACDTFAQFVFKINEVCAELGTVRLISQDGNDLKFGIANPHEQLRALSDAVRRNEISDVRLDPILVSARQERLHDRTVRTWLADGRRVVWDLGAGIEGFMDVRRPCNITRMPDSG